MSNGSGSKLPPFPSSYRASGLLLHVTSLPSPYGIGDVGPVAIAWIDQLCDAGQSWWQALPLGPTGDNLNAFVGGFRVNSGKKVTVTAKLAAQLVAPETARAAPALGWEMSAVGLAGAYAFYAIAAAISLPFVWAAVRETKGKTLEQMKDTMNLNQALRSVKRI